MTSADDNNDSKSAVVTVTTEYLMSLKLTFAEHEILDGALVAQSIVHRKFWFRNTPDVSAVLDQRRRKDDANQS